MKSLSAVISNSFFAKKIRKRKRGLLRGFLGLKKSGGQRKFHDLKRLLADNKLAIDPKQFSSFVMGDQIDDKTKELCIRQYLLLRCGAYKFNEALLLQKSSAHRRVIYPMPNQWRETLEVNGFQVAHRRTALLWYAYLVLLVGYGCITAMTIVVKSIVKRGSNAAPSEPYVYFPNLAYGNIPKAKEGGQSYDILSWYIKHLASDTSCRLVKHDVPGVKATQIQGINVESDDSGPIPDISEWKSILRFSVWSFFSALFALVDLLRGRWWHALIFNEAVIAKKASMIKPKNLARQYFFHQTSQTYRPLWTYTVENYGSEITLYFYSINIENLNVDPTYFWRCMTWPKYLVWDNYQADFIRRCTGNQADVNIVNSIWFHDGGNVKLPVDARSIAIFDVTPFRNSRYVMHVEELEYLVPKTCIAFVQNIRDIAIQENFICWYKAKRDIGTLIHPSYRKLLQEMFDSSDVSIIDPGTSPYDLILSSSLVICLPFTAPAIIARELGKPVCYYDPTGTIEKNHPAAHGIPIIGSKEILLSWIKEQTIC